MWLADLGSISSALTAKRCRATVIREALSALLSAPVRTNPPRSKHYSPRSGPPSPGGLFAACLKRCAAPHNKYFMTFSYFC